MAAAAIVTVASDGAAMLCVRGDLDLRTAPLLARELEGVATAETVLVDLDAVQFADLGGMRPLVRFALDGRTRPRVSITAGSAAVRTLLELSGLHAQFNVVGGGADR